MYDEKLLKNLETVNKLIYIICIHEASSALSNMIQPSIVQGREHWTQLATHITTIKSVSAYVQYKNDKYAKEIHSFQTMVLEDKFDITGC